MYHDTSLELKNGQFNVTRNILSAYKMSISMAEGKNIYEICLVWSPISFGIKCPEGRNMLLWHLSLYPDAERSKIFTLDNSKPTESWQRYQRYQKVLPGRFSLKILPLTLFEKWWYFLNDKLLHRVHLKEQIVNRARMIMWNKFCSLLTVMF